MQNYQSGMKTPDQLLQQEQQNLGTTAAQQQVSGLQKAIQNTTNLLNNVAPSVMGRTQNSLVTDAQANAQIANAEAPINQQLNQQQQGFDTANTNYQDLQQQAENLANANETAQQNQLGYLNNVYQALYGGEQQQKADQLQQEQMAQQQKQFEESLALQKQAASSSGTAAPTLGSGSFGSSNPQQNGMNMTQRKGGGFNFTGTNGQAISAGAYAKANNIPIGQLLYQMGQKGDVYAKQAYNEIQANQAYYQNHPEALKQEFSPLFWGS